MWGDIKIQLMSCIAHVLENYFSSSTFLTSRYRIVREEFLGRGIFWAYGPNL